LLRRIVLFSLTYLLSGASFIKPARAVMEDYPSVKLQGLDKSVGRTVTFEARVGSTIQYGPLFIKINACRKAPPIETPESAAFLQIWEVPPGQEKSQWVFSGWMFASSPALSAMDHPVYDVWVLECNGREEPNEEAQKAETDEKADQTDLAPATKNGAEENTEVETPAMESPSVPVDSEAEDDAAEVPATENPAVPDAASTPSAVTEGEAVPQNEEPYPVPTENQPANDQGVTAYDFMKTDN
jgi:hypothetical protein